LQIIAPPLKTKSPPENLSPPKEKRISNQKGENLPRLPDLAERPDPIICSAPQGRWAKKRFKRAYEYFSMVSR